MRQLCFWLFSITLAEDFHFKENSIVRKISKEKWKSSIVLDLFIEKNH